MVWPLHKDAERPETTDALARSERRFRLAVQASGSLVYEWRPAHGTVEWFGDVDAALGLPPGGLPRTLDGWASVLHPHDRATVVAIIDEVSRTREPFTIAYRVLRADGTVRYWREHGFAMPDEDELVFIGACTDVTAQRLTDDQVRQAQRLEAISALTGGMAHDVNNLLSIVQGYGELLRDELEGRATGLQLLDEVLHAVQRTGLLTRHLLAFSRRQLLRPRTVALDEFIAAHTPALRALFGSDITLHIDVSEDTPQVHIDPVAFEQVLMQLASNARDAMLDDGTVHIVAARDARGQAVLDVRDSGRGMTPDVVERIFEPFFTTKAEARGAGLGLSSAYGTVLQSGGTLTVQSAPGSGSTFRIMLPAAAAAVAPIPEASPTPTSLAATGEVVLVVEDDTVFAMLMRRLLIDLGYEVMLAGGVQDALQQLRAAPRPVDVVITDMIMPGGSGRDLASALAQSHPNVPVLFMSGYSARQLERTAGGAPSAGGLLEKPFTQEALGRAVREALARGNSAS